MRRSAAGFVIVANEHREGSWRRDWNAKIIEEFRANDGRVGGQFAADGAPTIPVMFDPGSDPVRPELVAAIDRCWDELARPGTWWDGAAKAAIVATARAARSDREPEATGLPDDARAAGALLAASPATTSEAWVGEICEALGEPQYVELTGIVARVVAVDTFVGLLGHEPLPQPEPRAGEPTRTPPPDGIRRNHTWVSMAMPVPPFVLGSVPDAMAAMNDLSEPLYMPMGEMGDPNWHRGDLHRTQVELVAAAVSHENECFY